MRQKFSIAMRVAAATAAWLVAVAGVAWAADVAVSDTAPDRYTVQKGDTLWGISGKFLKQPWRWPEIWRLNRDQIKNPHLIYPGDVVVFDRNQMTLSLERGGSPVPSANTIRLSPTVRASPLDAEAIPSIPSGDLEPFLTRPLITGPVGLADAPEIVAGRDRRVVRGENDVVYVTGLDPAQGDVLHIYRAGRTLNSPVSGEVLGYEQRFVGTARVERFDEVSTVRIASAKEEIFIGDRLVPPPREQLINYAPHPPDKAIDGRIIATSRDSIEVGRGWVVTIDKGAADGVDIGTVLAIYRGVPQIRDPRPSNEPDLVMTLPRFDEPQPLPINYPEQTRFYQKDRFLSIPDERTGLMFVFRVFDRVSYALVLNTTDPVNVGDFVRKP
jgi:LysM domain